ncbi:hypothetical protein BDZ85DRAFT_26894 [Elsinoe ampelina]|uniref:Uncharacterized protein n=1 Tax=Elsinoe ampelina TaxID=302913 RepID=A0A6A6G3V7_9PEZI|nr:hypothetical protein BDZ85DRAFT_26894 [Elsinoe ampelina]
MSLVAMPDRRPSPTNTLGTNNPFRRASPDSTSPVKRSPLPSASQERPMSRNPFLDPPAGTNSAPRSEQDAVTAKLADDIFVSVPQKTRCLVHLMHVVQGLESTGSLVRRRNPNTSQQQSMG